MSEQQVPQLTLTPNLNEIEIVTTEEKQEIAPVEQNILSPEEQKVVSDFAKQINLHDANQVLMYGAGAQKNIADFSESALNSVRTKDLGEVGNALSSLVVELKSFDFDGEEEQGFFAKLFKKSKDQLEELKAI